MEPKLVMYQEVPYDGERLKSKTPCPFGETFIAKFPNAQSECIRFVGDIFCDHCQFFCGIDEENKIVKCTNKGK